MISVVAYSLLEEMPEDLIFFVRIRGYSELLMMGLIFLSTIFWNLKIGIAVGIGLSLLRVIRHATRPRIQILGRVPGTIDQFENAEREPGHLEFFEGCLIVKIPEPLTFANTGSLRARLQRLERYGADKLHPSMPAVRRKEHNKNIIFDVHGVTSLDGAGAQVLRDIVRTYVRSGVHVIFCRTPREGSRVWQLLEDSGVVEMVGGREMFVGSVQEALALTDHEGEGSLVSRDGNVEAAV
jgi:MFS superfamily sulfate permease-like transporter